MTMSFQSAVPRYMAQLLEELGWNKGTRIPLANSDNQDLESLLISRQNEIQHLKEGLILQNQKFDDLHKYKNNVQTEYQENTRLLFAHKQQLEQEVKLRQLSCNEVDRLDRSVQDCQKQSKEIAKRLDRFQCNIARLLKKADILKTEVCGERGALQEWRAALERNAGDISAIEQFSKQDLSRAKAMETKRQKLKVEHDRMHQRLTQLVSDLSAEERACERISLQVMEGMEQRQQMMVMWTNAIENLRQRDTDIRHIREDYAILEEEANRMTEKCREQQAFCDQQRANNAEAERENVSLQQKLSQIRAAVLVLVETSASLDSEDQSLQRELSNMRHTLELLHMENRRIMDEQHRRDTALKKVKAKITELKEKLTESLDKNKSSEKRAKQLEEILNDEERFASQLTVNQQRAMHCSFVEQQKLLALKNEEKLFHMQLKASKAAMSKLDSKQTGMERALQGQKESFYAICYQVETIGARVSHMEGAQTERECSAEALERENRHCSGNSTLLQREESDSSIPRFWHLRHELARGANHLRLKDVCARHAARVALLERHSARLQDDMRRLARDLESKGADHNKLVSRLKTALLNVEGSHKELRAVRDVWRRERVDEALMRLRVAHAARAVAALGDAAYSLGGQRLQLDAAMSERLVEIAARRDMFEVQRRALLEECGKLRADVREREQRVEQLVKRYDIFIASLGKDDCGQQLSVTFFKIKFAAERAELRERGAALDTDIGRRERDVSALEATLRVMHAAHACFVQHVSPIAADAPEIEELNSLSRQYYAMRDELKLVRAELSSLEQQVGDQGARLTTLSDKCSQLCARQAETESEVENARERRARQEGRLHNAKQVVRHNARRAKKLIEGVDDWRIFQMALWVRDYAEAAQNSLQALSELCGAAPDAYKHFAALVSASDLPRYLPRHQRRLLAFIHRIVSDAASALEKEDIEEYAGSVFSTSAESTHSGVSVASGYTRRLAAFRKTLAGKVNESALSDDIPETARRSMVSLRVVTLDLKDTPKVTSTSGTTRKPVQ